MNRRLQNFHRELLPTHGCLCKTEVRHTRVAHLEIRPQWLLRAHKMWFSGQILVPLDQPRITFPEWPDRSYLRF
jgi:hypothetical protein